MPPALVDDADLHRRDVDGLAVDAIDEGLAPVGDWRIAAVGTTSAPETVRADDTAGGEGAALQRSPPAFGICT